jgi:hypothetical protein
MGGKPGQIQAGYCLKQISDDGGFLVQGYLYNIGLLFDEFGTRILVD